MSGFRYKELVLTALAALCAVEGTWRIDVHHSWPFLVVVILAMISLGMALFFGPAKGRLRAGLAARLGHLGLLVVLLGGLFGASHRVENQVLLLKDIPVRTMPFELTLRQFSIEYYEDGVSPRQFTSVIESEGHLFSTSVNHPCRIDGYSVYQSDYDKIDGAYSIVKVVRDPWIAVIWVGMALLFVSALLRIGRYWPGRGLPAALLLAVAFGVISLASIRFGTLAPALRSFWFVPHIMIYMLAYSFLALSLVFGRKFLDVASSLLLLGMLCGAAWAKAAWGDCWSWDAKECWAAATWLLTLVGIHLPEGEKKIIFVIVVGLAFLAMQVTWFGVDYLPASINSLHTY